MSNVARCFPTASREAAPLTEKRAWPSKRSTQEPRGQKAVA